MAFEPTAANVTDETEASNVIDESEWAGVAYVVIDDEPAIGPDGDRPRWRPAPMATGLGAGDSGRVPAQISSMRVGRF